MRVRVKVSTGVLILGSLFSIAGCASDEEGDSAVPIEDIPDDKRIVDLTAAEREGVCDWASSIAREELPPPGTTIDCDGFAIQMNAPMCSVPVSDLQGCTATIAEYKVCLPAIMARIGADPCQLLDITTDEDANYFVVTTPGCEGMGSCATAL